MATASAGAGKPSSSCDNDGARRKDQDDDDDDVTARGGRAPYDDDDDDDDYSEMEAVQGMGGDAGWISLKKCIEDHVYDATMIQRWMGIRRATKGIEVMIRDLLQHGEL